MLNTKLEYLINEKLGNKNINDYAPNGLQIEGRKDVNNIVTGVTICQELLNKALKKKADSIIVHHGFLWKNDDLIINGIKRHRLKTILINDINLYAWHLPLDLNMEIGNNVQIASKLKINIIGNLNSFVMIGELDNSINGEDMFNLLRERFNYKTIYCNNGSGLIKRLAWCSGAGQKFLSIVGRSGVDAYITGEVSEESVYLAKEYMIHFYSIGHHSSEIGGIFSLGNWLKESFDLEVTFIDVPNLF